MLAIRLQRTGRKGHSQYRVIVQDSRFSPKSGRIVSYLGSYNPHTKAATVDTELASKYLSTGAQPSDRAASILKESGVKLPKWYSPSPSSKKSIKNPEKLRKNRPAGTPEPAPKAEETEEVEKTEETPAEENTTEAETTKEEPAEEAPKAETEPEKTEAEPVETPAPAEESKKDA